VVAEFFPYSCSNILVATPDGAVFCSGLALPGPVDLGERTYFQEALITQEPTVSDYLIRSRGEYTMYGVGDNRIGTEA